MAVGSPSVSSRQTDPDPEWWKRRPGSSPAPYKQLAVGLLYEPQAWDVKPGQTPGRATNHAVQFFPYGEHDFDDNPQQDPKGFRKMVLEWKDVFATCGGQKLVLARTCPKEGFKLLFEVSFPDDDLYTIAWSFDPFTWEPIIAVAGVKSLIHIVDLVGKRIRRVLKGHGGEVYHLAFCHTDPHILASCSADKTTRIWNILGADLPPLPSSSLDWNYPMGQADEGESIVAVLAGEGSGGHKAGVVCVTFHPQYRAVVTGGLDWQIRIWALPEYPKPVDSRIRTRTKLGYRPEVIYHPVFATGRLHTEALDWVEWLSDDVLVSKTGSSLVTWRWLRFPKVADPETDTFDTKVVRRSDWSDSHSFRILGRSEIKSYLWYQKAGLHRAFETSNPQGKVTDILIATGLRGRNPSIMIWNPTLIDYPPTPPVPKYHLRKDILPIEIDLSDDEDDRVVEDDSSDLSDLPVKMENGKEEVSAIRSPEENPVIETGQLPRLCPWTIKTRGFDTAYAAARRNAGETSKGDHTATTIQNVALSPGGAEWMVSTGERGYMMVHRLRSCVTAK